MELEPDRSLLDHVALIQDLSDLLGRQVDVATEIGLRENLREPEGASRSERYKGHPSAGGIALSIRLCLCDTPASV